MTTKFAGLSEASLRALCHEDMCTVAELSRRFEVQENTVRCKLSELGIEAPRECKTCRLVKRATEFELRDNPHRKARRFICDDCGIGAHEEREFDNRLFAELAAGQRYLDKHFPVTTELTTRYTAQCGALA